MTDEEFDRLRFLVWHDTVRRIGHRGGLMSWQLDVVRRDLLPGGIFPAGSIPADLEPDRIKLLDEVCAGLAAMVGGPAPDFPPEEPTQ
ncbi:hypothetical protein [Nocardioides pocheonensis]|uniref:Uncharacterized protein n=1 Tax=Nocardioides pocheonensis TaxID=661485 RepID=A0A3N0GM86_9ACTN|nr:hypothetical protein [Nocardioides pocheonensis]RNM13292.1 hypothetical protein EFL26_15885 [Nocardioides pocheonensis]